MVTCVYVYLNGQPLAKIEGTNVYYYHNDALGTPQKMTDSTGTVVWAADYKPFGEATVTVSTITNNLRFPGQYFDAETGNHYNYFRDYNPVIGRYIEADPIGIKEGNNHIFVYAKNNPLNNADRSGLFSYNTDDPMITGRLQPDIEAKVSYIEICLATDLVVTGGWEGGHSGGALGPHGRSEAVDFSFARNPQLRGMKDKFMCCAKRAGFNFGQYEPRPPHFHIQIGTGRGGATGDMPDCCRQPRCCV